MVAAPIDVIPLFVKAGSILTLGEPVESTNERQRIAKVKVYGGADGQFVLYNDDGTTYAYEKGENQITTLKWNDVEGKLTKSGAKAWEAAQSARNPRRYWDWRPMIENGRQVQFCGTPPIAHFFGLEASLDMIEEEGLENVFIRHRRLANATRACVRHWGQKGGIEIYPLDAEFASDSLTAVLMPAGHDADRVRTIAEERYGVALGRGLAVLQGRVFRIGHMGALKPGRMQGLPCGLNRVH